MARERFPRPRPAITLGLLLLTAAVAWWLRLRADSVPADIPAFLAREHISGAVLAQRSADGTIILHTYGKPSAGLHATLDKRTRFPIASLTKPMTAAAIRRLVATGRLQLDDKVFLLMPEMDHADDPRYDMITVQHLLQHSSGLSQVPHDPRLRDGQFEGCEIAIRKTLRKALDDTPGTRSRYSNTGYCLLGRLLEKITGKRYEAAMRSLVFSGNAGTHLTLGPPPPGSIQHEGHALTASDWRSAGAAGGWFGDAATIARILGEDARDPTIPTMEVAIRKTWFYGLGWRVWPDRRRGYRLSHFGRVPGAFSVVIARPDGSASVILFNGRPGDGEQALLQLMPLIDPYAEQNEGD